jgi:5'-phosphate synthase pdxT subunit
LVSASRLPGPPTVGVLAIQGAFREHVAALERVGARPREVRTAEHLEGLEGIVIPGGESTTIGLVGSESGLLAALRERLRDGLPAFGTCAGMIMLARRTTGGGQPLIGGMDIVVRRNAYGRQRASFEATVEVPELGPPGFPAIFIRAPWVERAGPGVDVLAELDGRPVAVRQGGLLATAFHPELTDDVRLHGYFSDTLRTRPRRHERSEGESGVGTQ